MEFWKSSLLNVAESNVSCFSSALDARQCQCGLFVFHPFIKFPQPKCFLTQKNLALLGAKNTSFFGAHAVVVSKNSLKSGPKMESDPHVKLATAEEKQEFQ